MKYWHNCSNKEKTLRSLGFGLIAACASIYWFDAILQWERGSGPLFRIAVFIGFSLQAIYFGIKWRKDARGGRQ